MADDLSKDLFVKAKAASNMFRGSSNLPNTPKYQAPKLPTTPSNIEVNDTQDVGIGSRFLEQMTSETPQDESAQDQVLPEQETAPVASPEAIITKYKEAVQNAGFKDDEENLQIFIDQNPDPSSPSFDFQGLEPQTEEVVPAASKVLKNAIDSVPILSVLSGLQKPLEILGNAFSRYEAAKVGFFTGLGKTKALSTPAEIAMNVGGDVLGGITGTAKTEFPDAPTRTSNLPEFGDFLRAKGVPEVLASAGGLGLDLLLDVPVIGQVGKVLKLAGEGSKLKGLKNIAKGASEITKAKLMEMHSSRMGRAVVDMAKGKGMLDIGPAPTAFKQAVRESMGDANLTSFDANTLMNDFSRMINAKPDNAKVINKAMRGSMEDLAKFAPAEQAIIKQARSLIDQGSAKLKGELEYLRTSEPKRFGELDDLIETMRANEGHYTTRAFDLYAKKDWKPSVEAVNKAVTGMINDGSAKTEEQARRIIKSILDKGEVNVNTGKGRSFKIGPNVFKARQPLPEYIKGILGEVEDPRFNLSNTTRKISEAQSHLRVFRWMKENNYVMDKATKEFSEEIKGGPLAWGAIQGKFTTPEIADTIKGMQRTVENLDTNYMKLMQSIKAFKTVFNPKAQMHNIIGSLTFFGPLSGVSVFNKPQRYKEAIEVINAVKNVRAGKLSKDNPLYQVYRQAVANRVVGNELPNADQIKWLEDFIRNDGRIPEGVGGKVKAKLKDVANAASTSYALGDIIPKLATFLEYTKGRKMAPAQATEELYKWFQNPAEVSKLADMARNTSAGMALLNPFMSFRSEAHRILLNAAKDSPRTRLIMAGYLGAHTAFNSAMLGMMGMGLKDIGEFFMTRPEAMSETVLNPASPKGELDLNTRYIDPFNTRGLFAPLLALSGATGVNPFDYVMDFTAFSPDFGYSNLITNALLPALTGSGRMGEQLDFGGRVRKTIEAVGPSSLSIDLPKGVEAAQQGDNPEAIRRAFRFFGIDVEKRNPDYIKGEVSKRLVDKLRSGDDITSLVKVLNTMGFDSGRMIKNAEIKLKKESKLPKSKQPIVKYNTFDRVIDAIGGGK